VEILEKKESIETWRAHSASSEWTMRHGLCVSLVSLPLMGSGFSQQQATRDILALRSYIGR
jgi:hypothetical protein